MTKKQQQQQTNKNKKEIKNSFLMSYTNLHFYLISEQRLVQQASLYTENRVITLLVLLLSQHGLIHGDFVKIWEQTSP